MNHLEQLVSEWLQYRGYFVRVSVQVGARERGGYEGELDVVAVNVKTRHLLHVECSIDAHTAEERERRFKAKFDRGKKYVRELFHGLELPADLDQVVVHLMATGNTPSIGGGRLVTVRGLVAEINEGLKGTSPLSKAVPSNLPLLRTLQLAAYAGKTALGEHPLVR